MVLGLDGSAPAAGAVGAGLRNEPTADARTEDPEDLIVGGKGDEAAVGAVSALAADARTEDPVEGWFAVLGAGLATAGKLIVLAAEARMDDPLLLVGVEALAGVGVKGVRVQSLEAGVWGTGSVWGAAVGWGIENI